CGRQLRHAAGHRLSGARYPKGRAVPRVANRTRCAALPRRRPRPGRAEVPAAGRCSMSTSIKRWVLLVAFLLVAFLLASFTAACGNGGTTIVGPPPPPPTGNFSNANLKGQ